MDTAGGESDDDLADRVEFRPGWPDIFLHGLIVGRSAVTQLTPDDDDPLDADDTVEWVLHIGVREPEPRLALLGELTVSNPIAYGEVTVVAPFELRDEPVELGTDELDGILLQYGDWVSSVMYDHAATVLRTALAGNGLPLTVPYSTPPAQLHTSQLGDD